MLQVPIIEDNGKVVNESFDIALYLERTYPDKPSLFGGPGGAPRCCLRLWLYHRLTTYIFSPASCWQPVSMQSR